MQGRGDLETLWQTLAATAHADAPGGFAATIRPAARRRSTLTPVPLPHLSLAGTLGPGRGDEPGPESNADFEVVGVLGEGGMGRVHLARQRALGRDVALKTIKDERSEGQAVELLGAEARVMGRIEHPNVVPVHMLGVDARERLVLVMKRIEGVEWRALLRDEDHPHWAVLDVAARDRMAFHLDVLAQVANALHFAHSRGVVHRDVKPENVMIGAFGEVYLVDWGIALDTSVTRQAFDPGDSLRLAGIVGTPAYMAPELASGAVEDHGPATDVYLLGAALHEVLTGTPPHRGPTLQAVLLTAYESEPRTYPPEVPDELAELATRAMARDPGARPASALAFRRALDTHRRHRGSIALARTTTELLERARASDPADPGLERMLVECRFGFVQALREWPDNLDARAGLTRCLATLAERELGRDNLEGARSLIAELREAGSETTTLATQAETLAGRLAKQRAEVERAAAAEHDRDLELGWRVRAGFFGGLTLIGVVVTVVTVPQAMAGNGVVFGHPQLVGFAVGFVVLYGLSLLIGRRTVFANAANRKLTAIFGLLFASLFTHRVLAWHADIDVLRVLAMDQLLFAFILASSALAVSTFWQIALPWFVCGVVSMIWPATTIYAFGVSTLGSLGVVMLRWNTIMRGKLG